MIYKTKPVELTTLWYMSPFFPKGSMIIINNETRQRINPKENGSRNKRMTSRFIIIAANKI